MTTNEQLELKRIIVLTSLYYSKPLPDEVVRMYVSDLADLPFDPVVAAIGVYRRNPKNLYMFLPAHLRDIVCPQANNLDLARDTALRIMHAVKKFGHSNSQTARTFVGEEAWTMVNRWGGWETLCKRLGEDLPEGQFMAQCRDSILSNLNLQDAGVDTSRPTLEQAKENNVISLVKRLSNILEMPGGKNVPT